MMMRIFVLLFLLTSNVQAAFADDSEVVSRWYQALRTSDRAAFAELMTDDARVMLNQLGVVQSREEFIEALDTWEEVASGVQVRFSVDRVDAERLVAIVCYRFPDNLYTNRETFSFENGKIFLQVQERERDSC